MVDRSETGAARSSATADEIDHLLPYADSIRIALSAWFDLNARDLPWRRSHDPYLIYLSEVILQQTRVDQGMPYFLRFAAAFPTVEDLARASLDAVLKEWEGLGYYSRARNLHRAAHAIMTDFSGCIPSEYDALISLPGIGEYTASAILSIAFDRPFAVVDGNVIRVLTRLAAYSGEVSTAKANRALRLLASEILDRHHPGRHNEALMELGALICSPRDPQCSQCPLNHICVAFKTRTQSHFPVKKSKPPIPHYEVVVGIISNHEREYLIQRRAESGMLGGLWEFPGGKRTREESLQDACRREIREELGVHVDVGLPLSPIRHAYSHFKITLHAFHCEIKEGTPRSEGGLPLKWVARENIRDYAFPKANERLFTELNL